MKLLGSLSPLEPRLAKKLQEPLTDIITTTPAKSLLYECINTLLTGEIKSKSVIRLCLDKLRAFIEDPDQNLKYLGLLGLHRLMRKHPRAVAEHKDLILACLSDEDVTIRMRALDLITSMVSQRNVVGIVRKMMEHLQQSEGVYREHVLSRILSIGAQENYSYISDFEWYISVLVDLTHLTGASVHNAVTITQQLTDVSIRVPAVRRYAVKAMSDVLLAGRLLGVGGGSNAMSEVLHAAAFIVGEYSEYVEEHLEVIRVMMRREVSSLSGETQNVFVQNVVKVLASGLYQPYDLSGEDEDVSMEVKVKDLLGRREVEDEEDKEEEGDEVKEESERAAERAKTAKSKEANEDVDPEQEEEEWDANGCKKRKVKAKRRSYQEFCTFVGEMLECLYVHLPVFTRSPHVEVQERAVAYHEFVVWLVEQAQMQPFISVPVERRTRRVEAKEEPSEKGKKDGPAPPTDLLADDHPITSALSPRHLNGSLPPSSLLSSLAIQVNLLFSERLNPVNPKAQRKVPLPKGLNLDATINPGWDVDSDKSEEESSESSEEEEGSKKRKRKDRKREKERGGERKKKSKERSSGGLFDEEDYSKPLTEAEKAEAKRRLEARRAAQAADPFYMKDRPSASASLISLPTGDATVQRLSEGDLPPLHVESEKERKKKKKHRKGKGGDDSDGESDDIFAGVGRGKGQAKVFKVKKTDDMPSGAESSEEDRDDDLNAPLRDDEVIPQVKAYGSEEKEKKRKKHKDRRWQEEDGDKKKDRKKREKEKEKKREGRGEDKGSRSKEAAAVDEFDPMGGKGKENRRNADEEDEEGRDERKKRKKKEKERELDREREDREREKEKKRKDKGRDKEEEEEKERHRDRKKDKEKDRKRKA